MVLRDSVGDAATAQARLADLSAHWQTLNAMPMSPTTGAARLARARLLRRVGKQDEALRWYDTFPGYGTEDFMFRATAALERARTLRAAGNTEAARASYTEAAWLLRDAEPVVRQRAGLSP